MGARWQGPAPTRHDVVSYALVVVFITVLALLAATAVGPDTPSNSVDPFVDCQEDMPCWDCTTMGNMICGPLVPDPGGVN